MKLVEFVYVKDNDSRSTRAVIELVAPTKFVEGIDVSDLDATEFAEFCAEYGELKRKQHEENMQILAKFDLTHNYRRFDPAKMHNVTKEYV
jgi:hypothetical protein